MDFLDFIKKAMTGKGVNLMLNNGKKKKNDHRYDPAAWRREIDKENDEYEYLNGNDF